MKSKDEKQELRVEICERCALACDAACVAEAERDRFFTGLLRYGIRPL
jgi:hypothetical protein